MWAQKHKTSARGLTLIFKLVRNPSMSVTRADSLIVSTMSRVADGSVDESLCLGRLYQIPGNWFSSLNSPFVLHFKKSISAKSWKKHKIKYLSFKSVKPTSVLSVTTPMLKGVTVEITFKWSQLSKRVDGTATKTFHWKLIKQEYPWTFTGPSSFGEHVASGQ